MFYWNVQKSWSKSISWLNCFPFIEKKKTLEASWNRQFSLKTCICKLHIPFSYLHICKKVNFYNIVRLET